MWCATFCRAFLVGRRVGDGANGGRPWSAPVDQKLVGLSRAARELLWAFNPGEGGGVMLERAATDDGVVIVALRSDRRVAELSTHPCARRRPGGRPVHPAPRTRTV